MKFNVGQVVYYLGQKSQRYVVRETAFCDRRSDTYQIIKISYLDNDEIDENWNESDGFTAEPLKD